MGAGTSVEERAAAESAKLIETAKANGFFWNDATKEEIEPVLSASPHSSGFEHEAYFVGEAPGKVVIRNTYDGFGAYDTPSEYLQRLIDYNQTFPELQMRLIGVSTDDGGNPVLWTVQKFVEAKELGNQRALAQAMQMHGWKPKGHVLTPVFVHEATGTVIEDAHPGNILERDGKLYPIDVHIKKPPAWLASRGGASNAPTNARSA